MTGKEVPQALRACLLVARRVMSLSLLFSLYGLSVPGATWEEDEREMGFSFKGAPCGAELFGFRSWMTKILADGNRLLRPFDFDFCLSTSIPVLTTSTYVVAWPQGDQLF